MHSLSKARIVKTHLHQIALFALAILLCLPSRPTVAQSEDVQRLSKQLAPWLSLFSGQIEQFTLSGNGSPVIDGKPQPIQFRLAKFDDDSFDLDLIHTEYAVQLRRRAKGTAFCVPKHNTVYLGTGDVDATDHLSPNGVMNRLVSAGSAVRFGTQLVANSNGEELAETLLTLAKLQPTLDGQAWLFDNSEIRFAPNGQEANALIDGTKVDLKWTRQVEAAKAIDDWPGMTLRKLPRAEIEKQLARGVRRALEVLAPSALLTSPNHRTKQLEHGELRWVEGQRVALLQGTPEQIGQAHGKLLKQEAIRCIDSVMYAFGTAQTILTGRWFREDLEIAYSKLSPHIPERHKVETRALASSLELNPDLIEALNVFPELFHCSGFAIFGKATEGGKLYHGRVLDYMTAIGLQDAATTFIVAPDGMIPFVNVGYAGFIGSVSGMNAEKISLGEMGGKGEGQWDGVPMATLMRRGLEECSSLEQVKDLWRSSPRTCEYYYVFADGEEKSAVGVAATPGSLQFVAPGETHPLLGDGIEDAVVLSAGSRLEELRKRVKQGYGKFDEISAKSLMARPVAMTSNLHNVLFVPEDGVLYVANADHKRPAAERPYVKLDLLELLKQMPGKARAESTVVLSTDSTFEANDSLNVGDESNDDTKACLDGLKWAPTKFPVRLEAAQKDCGDWLVRFPSPKPTGNARNDEVAMEWYQVKNKAGQPLPGPAAVIIHESGSGMTVGRMIAKALRAKGIHTFMVQLPYYGVRRGAGGRPKDINLIGALQQGITDARRAKDAVACMPYVDTSRISLQGTSLGGFVTATTAGLDQGYHRVIVFLAGGDLYSVIMEGKKESEKVREELLSRGMSESDVRQMLLSIEPLRLANRVDPAKTWLFSALYDDVVPPRNSKLFAEAAHLQKSHHLEMEANHYSGVVFLPTVTQQMADIMSEKP